MEETTEYIVVWLYQDSVANDGRFIQGMQSFGSSAAAVAFSDKLKEYEQNGTMYQDELVSHVTIVNQVGRDIYSTLVVQ